MRPLAARYSRPPAPTPRSRGTRTRTPTRKRVALARPGSSIQSAQALVGCDDVGEPDAELVVDHYHFALGDEAAVHQHVHGLAGEPVQLDHRALHQLQEVAD